MAVNVEKVKELLGQNLSNAVVATAVGCDDSYISQLMADETFSAGVVLLRAENLLADSKRDDKANTLEDQLLDKLQECMNNSMIYKPGDVLRAYAVLNAAKRRGVSAPAGVVINQTVVNLTIPERVVQNFTMTEQGEVVEVEGQTLVTMPAHQLLRNLMEKRGEKHDAYETAAKYLPQSAAATSR